MRFDYERENIVIVGLGMTGISCVNFFLSKGIIPRVMDSRITPPYLHKLSNKIKYCSLGEFNEKWLLKASLIIVSPGISLNNPKLMLAADRGIKIIGDIDLFLRETNIPVVAITGSNGKSTVTSLIGKMAGFAGWRTGIGGNIGFPALVLLKNQSCQLYVLELSSFQLETTYYMKTIKAATVLNVHQEHINRYPLGIEEYRKVKIKIYQQADFCIFNAEDNMTFPDNNCTARSITFGIDSGDYHLTYRDGNIWITAYDNLLLNCSQIQLKGLHNYMNILAALALAKAVDIPIEACISAIKTFRGLPHRLEIVHEKNGICWINDSKSTNPSSTQAAIEYVIEYVQCKRGGVLHLLLGGDSKNTDFMILSPLLKERKVKIYCFGKDGYKMMAIRPDVSTFTENLEKAMYLIRNQIKPGDCVLLSPACASVDQFENFENRGNLFTTLAHKIG
ncbi:UDP-N-acetylmuramoyl-L-alanine--D-glutamate ligase [Candidatus Schneideria nysicola]|uniref:UDP-N-acetylmuramoyl-L-alanine--D-glutamate ligase n=1 Tax=Candidatus Schneideria nysicola TaxID=1081631 RepID=UPI001CAA4D20|nr:UDP-N-acetylmuramoyl-L-alanine--D-glutamate ligase [Candidatus Schneideria nysicola]UAJ65657.1 UDP-N-acetylmuramoyl-L-alanine--D-glutamate ligase [Candidatus Schneideria nysicola]